MAIFFIGVKLTNPKLRDLYQYPRNGGTLQVIYWAPKTVTENAGRFRKIAVCHRSRI